MARSRFLRRPGLARQAFATAFPALFAFMILYNISFQAAPSVSTGRVALVLLTLVFWRRLFRALPGFLNAHGMAVLVFGCILMHALLLYWLGAFVDPMQVSRLFHFLAYAIFGVLVFGFLVRSNPYRFASAVALAGLVQAVLILYSYVSAEYRTWLADLLVQGGNIPLETGSQVPGFSNSSGALLSLIQAAAVFCALYAARLGRSARSVWAHTAAAFVILLSTLVVGRTGLLLSIAFFVLFAAVNRGRHRAAIVTLTLIGAALGLAAAGNLLSRLYEVNPDVTSTLDWVADVRHGTESASVADVWNQELSTLTPLEVVVGTGRVSDEANPSASGSDSGYVQTYYALGAISGTIFYGTFLLLLWRCLRRSNERFVLGALVIAMFVVEVKEPFIFKYSLPFVAFSLCRLSVREIGLSHTSVARGKQREAAR